MSTSNPSLERALALYDLGLAIIPIPQPIPGTPAGKPGDGKTPAINWKRYQSKRADRNALHAWFAKPQNNAIVTGAVSGLVVIDTDTPEAEEWAQANLPETPWLVRTAKGYHRYYRRHHGGRIRNKARVQTADGRIALDVRADGGYVIGPGSVHASGAVYEQEGDWTVSLADLPLFDPKLIEAPRSTTKEAPVVSAPRDDGDVVKRARAYLAKVPGAVQGQGGDAHTLSAASRMVRGFGLSERDALEVMSEWNGTCEPPWSQEELETKIRNAALYCDEPIGGLRDTPKSHLRLIRGNGREAEADAPEQSAGETADVSARAACDNGHETRVSEIEGEAEPRVLHSMDALRLLPPAASASVIASFVDDIVLGPNGDSLQREALRATLIQECERFDVLRKGAARFVDAALSKHGPPRRGDNANAQGSGITFKDPDPWPDPVDGAALLTDLAKTYGRFLMLPEGGAEVLALWTAHTYALDVFDHTGYLAIVSPMKRCGKSTGLQLAKKLARRAISADSITPAALFRMIEHESPTLVMDELDGVPRDSDLWCVLNSGHSRGGRVIRTVGDDYKPRSFNTFGAKVLGYIRKAKSSVPDTVEDRSIRITMQRQKPGEREKLRSRTLETLAVPLVSKLSRWADDNMKALGDLPEPPPELDDRAADSWEPLLAVADAAGGPWPERARRLAVQFSSERVEDDAEDSALLLLMDLRALVDSGALSAESGVSGEEACEALRGLDERPWGSWGRDGLQPVNLARLLRPFKIKSKQVRIDGGVVRRYPIASLRDAMARYCPSGSEKPATPATASNPLHVNRDGSTSVAGVAGVAGRGRCSGSSEAVACLAPIAARALSA